MNILEKQFRATHKAHTKLMTRILNGDAATAEEVVQETYLRALTYFPSFDPKRGPFIKWFNMILFNTLRDIQREYQNRPKELIEGVSFADILTHEELPMNVEQKILEVENEKHQRILYLFYVLGYNSREISQIEAETSQTNVTTVVARFRDKLKEEHGNRRI